LYHVELDNHGINKGYCYSGSLFVAGLSGCFAIIENISHGKLPANNFPLSSQPGDPIDPFLLAKIILERTLPSYRIEKEISMDSKTNFPASYLDYSDRDDVLCGGVKMIPIQTPRGTFQVWTKRIGNHPTMKVLLLHGGPGGSHEYLEAFDSFFPAAGIEYYYYDQLCSYYSDQPDDPVLLEIDRFVEEVEQVRIALHLERQNFYLFGHSWGGMLAIEYALKYQEHLKGLIISNMMASIPQYNEYAQKVLMPAMDPDVLAEIQALEAAGDFEDPRYMELLIQHFYVHHLLRIPVNQWPEPVIRGFKHLNSKVYVPMQGYSELGSTGTISGWDRTPDLGNIEVPCLVIGACYDTMDPAHMEWMASAVQHGRYLYCPNGSHSALYDDQQTYFRGMTAFVKDVDAGSFP
jgi:proline iminopeptidase